jgi:hypothetical protein
MSTLFMEGPARLVVVVHALAAMALCGAATHHAIVAIGYLRGVYKVRLARIYAAVVAASWAVTFALGLLAYPTFRYVVRALYLDRYEPWASSLFDVKEYAAALGMPIALGLFALSRVVEPKTDRAQARVYVAMTVLVAAIVWFEMIAGLVITMVKGV